jgi:type IV secretion system protein TrbC
MTLWSDKPSEGTPRSTRLRAGIRTASRFAPVTVLVLLPRVLYVQAASPWGHAVDVLRTAFTAPIARGLSLVAIVVGGLAFAFGEGQSKRLVAAVVFGVGMAIGAVNFTLALSLEHYGVGSCSRDTGRKLGMPEATVHSLHDRR